MIDTLWWLCLALFASSFIFEAISTDTWSYTKERAYAKLALIAIIGSLFCGGLAMYITSKTCEDSVEAKAAGISDRCYKGITK